MTILKSLMAGVPYGESGLKVHEGRFRDVIYILCKLMGMSVNCEMHTNQGRIDMTADISMSWNSRSTIRRRRRWGR